MSDAAAASRPKSTAKSGAKNGEPTFDVKSTVFLPETVLPMRAGLAKREPQILARWAEMDLYARQRDIAKDRPRYELHDGPPYANGHLHLGHALNKILKDIVVRSHQMLGHDSRYVPGWDCHGLPIEWKIEEQYRAKGVDKDKAPVNDFRAECRAFAERWVEVQREEFKRLGVLGEWDRPYLTMSYEAEAVIAREFMKFVMNGTLYRGSKPVMWSPIEKTALAEAEVEYHDHESHTIWVKFPVDPELSKRPRKDVLDASVVIWTTTPWTIPSNRGIAFSETVSYGLYEVTEAPADNWTVPGDKLILADALAESSLAKGRVTGFKRRRDVTQSQLARLVCRHPFAEADPFWSYEVPLMPGGFVTDEAGTGFVHIAPSHGADDFELFARNGLLDRITHNVDAEGAFAAHVPIFAGKRILKPNGKEGDANKAVIEQLSGAKSLLARGKLKHSYPHSWRSKAPLIFRNTPQWFVAIDKPIQSDDPAVSGKTIRAMALDSIDRDVRWVPRSGRNRLYSMIESRPDWVLSRQRAWGVPLTCFMRRKVVGGVEQVEILRDADVNGRIEAAFREEGADAWFRDDAAARFLGADYDAAEWEKVTDILDVWFDSGSTHAFALEARRDEDGEADGVWPASIYLEGTDQHRGWFHSSLLEACATRGRAPYDCVLTHGFALDEKGQKMSKSLGNGVAPQDVIKDYGADVLRLWVVQSDFTEDLRIGPEILKNVADNYRRLRNVMRYLLGGLKGFTDAERLDPSEMPELERFTLHRLAELAPQVEQGYRDFDYAKLYAAIFNFCTGDLSALQVDVRKDALYCDGPDSLRRRAARTAMALTFERLVVWLAPMLPFTMEDLWLARRSDAGLPIDPEALRSDPAASVHLQSPPETPASWRDESLAARWTHVRATRRVVNSVLETARRDKQIGASLEAAPVVYVSDPQILEALQGVDLAELFITSAAQLEQGPGPDDALRLDDAPGVAVTMTIAEGSKCDRCWRILPDVRSAMISKVLPANLCGRCRDVVRA